MKNIVQYIYIESSVLAVLNGKGGNRPDEKSKIVQTLFTGYFCQIFFALLLLFSNTLIDL
jgi:hypothetical protein